MATLELGFHKLGKGVTKLSKYIIHYIFNQIIFEAQ